MKLACVFLVNLLIFSYGFCKISDRQYASMPVLFQMDSFERCMMYEEEALYCMITFQLLPNRTNAIWNTIEKVSSSPKNYRHDILRHGICIPESCPNIHRRPSPDDFRIQEGLTSYYNRKYMKMGLNGTITKVRCQTQNSSYPIGGLDIAYAVIVLTYIAFVIIATVYEGTARFGTKEEYAEVTRTSLGRVASAFSITKNWERLKSINMEDQDVQNFKFIQGVRFYGTLIVISLHECMANLAIPVHNPRYAETMTDKFTGLFLVNAGYPTQLCFVFSAWIMTYQLLILFPDGKTLRLKDVVLNVVYRYIRLTPTLAVVVGFCSTWLVHLSSGPLWDAVVGVEYRNCRSNGWTNILYINNYVENLNMCIPLTWYLSNDMQYVIISLLLFWMTWQRKERLFWILAAVWMVHVVGMFTLTYVNSWEPIVRPYPEEMYNFTVIGRKHWHTALFSIYANVPGFIVGIAGGHLYYNYKNKKVFTTNLKVAAWWIFGILLCFATVLVPAKFMLDPDYIYNPILAATVASLNKTLFAFGVAVGMFGITQGIGSFAKWMFEWQPLYILGRLSYCAFLGHLIFMRTRVGSATQPIVVTDINLVGGLLADVVAAYFLALVLTLLFELPTTAVLRISIKDKITNAGSKVNEKIKDKCS